MATYKGRSVTLNKPRRIAKGETSYGKKKSVVYVMDGDKAKRVTFGDPDMTIKKLKRVAGLTSGQGITATMQARKQRPDTGHVRRGNMVTKNLLKAAVKVGKPIVKGVGEFFGEAFDALGNKIGALPDAITTYHGSPHDFDEFDMSKIGTGEGAQAYGRGLYFAENENVAKEYRDNISSQALDGAKAVLQRVGGDVDAAIADRVNALSRFEERYSQGDIDDGLYQFMKNLGRGQIEQLKQYKNKGDFTKGHMYEVNIDATADDFLDWDKPLSEQPESFIDIVKNADLTILPEGGRLRRTIEAWRKNEGDWVPEISANIPEPTVKQIYSALTDFGTNPSKNANFSNELKNSGFKGVKYLDQFSRSAGAGTRNYVVFDDKLVSIVRKYGIAGAATIYGVSEADIANALQEGEQ
jgi:hypothetical protein